MSFYSEKVNLAEAIEMPDLPVTMEAFIRDIGPSILSRSGRELDVFLRHDATAAKLRTWLDQMERAIRLALLNELERFEREAVDHDGD